MIEKYCVCFNGVIKNAFQFKYDHSIVHLFFFLEGGKKLFITDVGSELEIFLVTLRHLLFCKRLKTRKNPCI